MFKRLILAFLLVLPVFAQSGLVWFSTAPTGGRRYEVRETLGTQSISSVGSRICGGHSAVVVKATGTTLTLFSGAAAATPQYILFPTLTKAATATSTLTLNGAGSNSGTVFVWAQVLGTTVTVFAGTNISGASTSCSGGLGCTDASATTLTAFPTGPGGTITPIWAWSVTSGAFDTSNGASGDAGLAKDCWVDQIFLSNTTATGAVVTIQDGLGTVFVPGVTLPANSLTQIPVYGGMVFKGGLFWNSGTASAINAYARFVRQTGPPTAP